MRWKKAQFGFKIPTDAWGPHSLCFHLWPLHPALTLAHRRHQRTGSSSITRAATNAAGVPCPFLAARARLSVHLVAPAHRKEPLPSGSSPSSSSSTSSISASGSVP
jgi:hypothetical protein